MIYVVEGEAGEETERLDRIARKLYGSEGGGAVEFILAANPGLAALGAFVPRGTSLAVPPKPAPAPSAAFTRVWD